MNQWISKCLFIFIWLIFLFVIPSDCPSLHLSVHPSGRLSFHGFAQDLPRSVHNNGGLTVFRCGLCISIRGFVSESVRWYGGLTIGPSVTSFYNEQNLMFVTKTRYYRINQMSEQPKQINNQNIVKSHLWCLSRPRTQFVSWQFCSPSLTLRAPP